MMTARKNAIDPAVADLLAGMDRQAERRALPADQRRKQAKAREKIARRNRITLDLPPVIEQRLTEIAEEQQCPISQVAAILIQRGISDYTAGDLNMDAYKTPSKSPRYVWNLKLRDTP
jgi:hypothetical protein